MTQSYPGPGLLQPQKISSHSINASSNEPNNPMDKEFLAELEKHLGKSKKSLVARDSSNLSQN